MYFWEVEKFNYGEINERSSHNPHPWSAANAIPVASANINKLKMQLILKTHSRLKKNYGLDLNFLIS